MLRTGLTKHMINASIKCPIDCVCLWLADSNVTSLATSAHVTLYLSSPYYMAYKLENYFWYSKKRYYHDSTKHSWVIINFRANFVGNWAAKRAQRAPEHVNQIPIVEVVYGYPNSRLYNACRSDAFYHWMYISALMSTLCVSANSDCGILVKIV